jgi:nitrate/nitrite transport system ATP-binding protein
MSGPILSLRGVDKGFPGRAEPVLAGIDLEIAEGEFAVVVGCSGSGKTTLVSLAAGLVVPDRGVVRFAGRPVHGPGPERAMFFQNYSLLPWLSALENVVLATEAARPDLGRREAREHALRFLELVRLGAAAAKRPGQLSGGMRQRVALARALAMEPRLLLLDEPLSALDALTRAALQDELARICAESGVTVVMVTNDIDEAILLADRVFPLDRGPRAALHAPIAIGLPRPRTRRHLSLEPEYQRARREVVAALSVRQAPAPAATSEPALWAASGAAG